MDPAELRVNVREMAAALIASGIDPNESIVFRAERDPGPRRAVVDPQGTARMGWLNRMTQWKDKAGKNQEGSSVGLFTYPVLQAADILLYNATHVPVGEDQKQHVELTRDIALKFNNDFDVDLFVPPEPYIGGGTAARVMSLRDGRAKMSKTDPSEQSRIHLTDSDEAIAQKIRKAKTDPEPLPDDAGGLDQRPEAKNLVGIYAAVTGESVERSARALRRPGIRHVQARAGRCDRRADRADPPAARRAAPRSRRARPHPCRRRRPGKRARGADPGRAKAAVGLTE